MPAKHLRPRILLLFCVIAVLAQVVFAPNIAIGRAVPNLLLVCLVLVSSRVSLPVSIGCGFLLGLISDLVTSAAVGSGALIFVLSALLINLFLQRFPSDLFRVEVVVVLVSLLFANLIILLVNFLLGFCKDLLGALLSITLPSLLYEFLLAVCILAIALLWANYHLQNQNNSSTRR
ncbi:MAG: rod shape-determining protein MreD [Coriobacteriales bacterium]|jgi:rod shape-determining protein MreD|nr:rod shape-determining protein MreD [Coriobacteriales bacterium]